jgi:hypothetical protein
VRLTTMLRPTARSVEQGLRDSVQPAARRCVFTPLFAKKTLVQCQVELHMSTQQQHTFLFIAQILSHSCSVVFLDAP